MILTGNRDALNPNPELDARVVAQLSAGHEDHQVGETTLALVLSALGDALLGTPFADALGLPHDTARNLAADRLRARLSLSPGRSDRRSAVACPLQLVQSSVDESRQ